jgi:inhibitor of cysteine peptidase
MTNKNKSGKPGIVFPVVVAVIAIMLIVVLLVIVQNQEPVIINEDEIANTFESIDDMKSFIEKNSLNNGYGGRGVLESVNMMKTTGTSAPQAMAADSSGGESASDYSTTNIQVEGVDEADIIKNDGKYIYVVSGNKVVIVNAYPAENMEVLSEIEIENGSIGEIFLNEDKLIVFANEYSYVPYARVACYGCVMPPYEYKEPRTFVHVYDIKDREEPELDSEFSVTGNYYSSRMIGDYVYVITNQYIQEDVVLPSVYEDGDVRVIEPTDIYYTDIKDYGFQYTIVLALDVDTGETSEKAVITGRTQNMYVSQKNIYTTMTKYRSWYQELADGDEDTEKTLINKISIDEMDIQFVSNGEVPGHILNQFSMDEHEDNFRIATTIGNMWDEENPSRNNVYVLDEELEVVGELEDLAPGERIYSVRFMGDRGYIVTFKKVDPLFVIDLEDPSNPNVLGKLKIPGYSDYLHPYDENHIIGIGKDTVEAEEELKEGRGMDFAWYQGVKMAIFDVSDVENPVELHKVVIGDRGTSSDALHNHKAFLFDREKELLVLPINLYQISEEEKNKEYTGWGIPYGTFTFQGAYVYKINLEDGFDLKGRISHYPGKQMDEDDKDDYSSYRLQQNWKRNVQRALYMDDILYTFSQEIIKANDLDDLDEINSVELPYEENRGYPEIYY